METIADNDITKHEAVLKMPAAHVFMHATYLLDYKEVNTPKQL